MKKPVFKKSKEQVELLLAMWSKDEQKSFNARCAFACLIAPTLAKLFPHEDAVSKSESIGNFTADLSSKKIRPEEAIGMVEDKIYADQLANVQTKLSDTPETDVATITVEDPNSYGYLKYVLPEFAEKLERAREHEKLL